MSSHKLQTIFEGGKEIVYKKNEIILRPDDTPQGIYYIKEGFVKIYSITRQGDEKLHIILRQDEIFPIIWTFTNIHRDIYYESLGNTIVQRIKKEAFISFLSENSDALFELMKRVAEIMHVYENRIYNLELTRTRSRLAARILFLAERFGKKTKSGIEIQIPITHRDLANTISITRETASRELEILEQKKIIAFTRHKITVLSEKKLQEEIEEEV